MSRYRDFREVEHEGAVYRVGVRKTTGRAGIVELKLPPARDIDHAKGWRSLWSVAGPTFRPPSEKVRMIIALSGIEASS